MLNVVAKNHEYLLMPNKHLAYLSVKFVRYVAHLREASAHQNGRIFGKLPKGGGMMVIFDPKILCAGFSITNGNLVMNFQDKVLIS